MQGRGILKKPPRVRDSNGAFQIRLRLDGRDHSITRFVCFAIQLPSHGASHLHLDLSRSSLVGLSFCFLSGLFLVKGIDQYFSIIIFQMGI